MKLKITKIWFNNTNKDGQPYLDKDSRPYTRVVIKTDQHGEKKLSGFAYSGDEMMRWREGQEVDIDVSQKGEYLNFRLPKGLKYTFDQFAGLENRVTTLERLFAKKFNIPGVDEPSTELYTD